MVRWSSTGCIVSWESDIEELRRREALARQMGERGRRSVTQEFSFARYITGLEDLFARVVGQTQEQVA